MKRSTIKWRILKYNLAVIFLLIFLVAVIFNIAVRLYIEKDILGQLDKIASRTEDTALRRGPDFFPKQGGRTPPPHNDRSNNNMNNANPSGNDENNNEMFRYYFELDRALREPLSVLNADYILLDSSKNIVNPSPDEYYKTPTDLVSKITSEVNKSKGWNNSEYLNFSLSGTEYISVVKPVLQKNTFGLGWVIIYSSIQKVNQLQIGINIILFSILIFSALIIIIFSSLVSKKISAPFSSLNRHLGEIAERNFGTKLQLPVDDELQEFVNNINALSEKLEIHDKAQKTFLQNASHEFRTPLMSIRSYAEGIKYEVIDTNTAVDIIIDETQRMTNLVEDLLYLSRLDAIEENYHFDNLNFNELLSSCVERLSRISMKNGIKTHINIPQEEIIIYADEEKLCRAINNIMSNCIRYADSTVTVTLKSIDAGKAELSISDDGPGFDTNELPNIFERFYKGKKGIFGLGLAISKNVIEKHNGNVTAGNSEKGALFIVELPIVHIL